MGTYFGTDGIRGVAGEYLTAELAFKLGQSLHKTLKATTIVIGKDTRLSSNMIAYSIASGAMSMGIDVIIGGVVSTPMIAYYSKRKSLVGVMVTASHNPYSDNGIKLFNRGAKLKAEVEREIERFLDARDNPVYQGDFGQLDLSDDVFKTYQDIYKKLDLEPVNLSVGYDSAHGANFRIAHHILAPLCDESTQINAEPDGKNINVGCGSTHMDAIQALVKEKQYDIGFSFDGDGDRCLVVDHCGHIIDGDVMIYAIAKYLKSKNQLKKNTVVLTKMSNPGIIKAFEDLGIKTVQTDVGDKYVSAEMMKHGYTVGGENSGHVILKDYLDTGDGLLVAVVILKMLQDLKVSLRDYISEVTMTPQKMENIRDIEAKVLETKEVKQAIKTAEKQLGSDALLLVRASGTEPVIRVTLSHKDEAVLDDVMAFLVKTIKSIGEVN